MHDAGVSRYHHLLYIPLTSDRPYWKEQGEDAFLTTRGGSFAFPPRPTTISGKHYLVAVGRLFAAITRDVLRPLSILWVTVSCPTIYSNLFAPALRRHLASSRGR